VLSTIDELPHFLTAQLFLAHWRAGEVNKWNEEAVHWLLSLLRSSKLKNLRFEDQIETLPLSFSMGCIGKKPSVLGDPKTPPTY
jgi:hypothetical protein